jgi:hypothetical protein
LLLRFYQCWHWHQQILTGLLFLEFREEEQIIEVGENAADNQDTNNSRENDEDHSTFEGPSSSPAALGLAPAQCTRAQKKQECRIDTATASNKK